MTIDVAPQWYLTTMHFTAITTTPINVFGVLIIVFCRMSQVSSLRWHLLTYQISSMITDFLINIGTLPVIFSPFPIGRPHGMFTPIFSFLGFKTSTEAQCIIVFVSIFLTAGSVELLFFLRYQAILPSHHRHKLTIAKSLIMIGAYQIFLISLMVGLFHVAIPNQSEARTQFVALYPHLEYLIQDEHTFFVCVHVEPIHVLFLSTCFLRLGAGMVTVCTLIWMSSRALHSFQLSTRTRRMHLELIRNLCYQISVPIVAFYVPILIVIVPLMFAIPDTQISFCVSIIFMSLHTCLGTLSMLYFHRPYRRWLLAAIRKRSLTSSFSASQVPIANRYFSKTDVPSALF